MMVKPDLQKETRLARQQNKLMVLFFHAPWSLPSRQWKRQVFDHPRARKAMEGFQVLRLDAHQCPEEDASAQSLMQLLAADGGGWPLSIVFWPGEGAVVGLRALDLESWESVLGDIKSVYDLRPEGLLAKVRANRSSAVQRDPFAKRNLGELNVVESRKVLASSVSSFLTPILQSLSFETGLLGEKHHFLYPRAYDCLATFSDEKPNLAEVSLSLMLRSPMTDPIFGGFFRSWSSEDKVLESEKLLIENAEILETMTAAYRSSRSPFLKQSIAEQIRFLLEEMFDADSGSFVEFLVADPDFYNLEPSDLIEILSGNERAAAQRFFGIESSGAWPRLKGQVLSLADELGVAPVDLRNQLLDIQKKIRLARKQSFGNNVLKGQTASLESEARVVKALVAARPVLGELKSPRLDTILDRFLLRVLHSDEALVLEQRAAVTKILLNHAQRRDWGTVEEKLFGRLMSTSPALLEDLKSASLFESALLGSRFQLADHLGSSRIQQSAEYWDDFAKLCHTLGRAIWTNEEFQCETAVAMAPAVVLGRRMGLAVAGLGSAVVAHQNREPKEKAPPHRPAPSLN